MANDKSQQHDLHYQFTSGNDEVVLLFQMAAENILCCGNRMLNCDLNWCAVGWVQGNKFYRFSLPEKMGWKVDKNDLNFNKQYVTKIHF